MPNLETPYIADGIEIASYIGDPELADMAAGIIQRFDEEGIIAHGIKRAAAVGDIALQGVLNNCPDGGKMESFWTAGQRIFLSEGQPYHPMRTFDTTFFNYSRGAIALTSLQGLEEQGIVVPHLRRHTTLTLGQPVPSEAIELIVSPPIDLGPTLGVHEARAIQQCIERSLLRELARIAQEGFTPGAIRHIR